MVQHITNDMSFAAWLIAVHGFKLSDARKLGKSYKFELYTDDSALSIKTLKLSYMDSDIRKFDNTIRDLKRVLFSDKQ